MKRKKIDLLKFYFLIFLIPIFFTGCGPGIPLTPITTNLPLFIQSDDYNQALTLSDPNHYYVNSETSSVVYTLNLYRTLSRPLTLDNIVLSKTGTADAETAISGSNTEYTITLSSFSGNGTLSLNFLIGSTTFSFAPKKIYVDNQIPSNPIGWILSSPTTSTTSNDTTPIISATGISGEEGSTASLFNDSECSIPVSSVEIENGEFSFTSVLYLSDGSDDGILSFYGLIIDLAGNRSECIDLSFGYKLDSVQPSDPSGWSFQNITNGETSGNFTPQIGKNGLSSENGSTVRVYLNSSCNSNPAGFAVISAGSFTISNITFASDGSGDGIKTFYGTITDSAGNISNCTNLSLTYKLDSSIPSVSITSPINTDYINSSNQSSFTISGSCSEDGQGVTVAASGGPTATPTCSGLSWTTNLNLTAVTNGSVTITANHSNTASTPAIEADVTLTKDSTPPSDPSGWSLGSPSDGVTSSDYTPQISGGGLVAENGASINIYMTGGCTISVGTATVSGGTFTVSNISFTSDGTADGTKTFYGKITDVAGNSSDCVDLGVSYLLDTTNPAGPSGWSISSPSLGATSNDITPQIAKANGLDSENGSSVEIFDAVGCTTPIGSAVIAGGAFTVTDITYLNDGNDDGTKSFYGKITDVSGNSSSCVNLSLGYLLDTTAPDDPTGWLLDEPNSGSTSSDNTPEISGGSLGGENGGSITIYDSIACAVSRGSATISGGSFTVSNISYLTNGSQDGTKTFYGKITDTAQNESNCVALNLSYLLDTTDPSDPSGWTMGSPSSGTTSKDVSPEIGGSGIVGEDGSTVTIHATGACASAIGSATIAGGSFTVSNISYLNNGTQDGTKAYYGIITDTAGNSSSCIDLSLGYLLDTTAPSNPSGWSMGSPNSGTTSNDYTPQISKANGLDSENGGSIEIFDAVGCITPIGDATIAGGAFTVSNISYSDIGLDDGTKSFYGKVIDVANNSSSCNSLSLGYLLDRTAPTLSITTPTSSDIINRNSVASVTISGSCSEEGRTVTVSATGGLSATPSCSSGSYTVNFNFNSVSDGAITITADMSDAVGNSATQVSVTLSKITALSVARSISAYSNINCAIMGDSSLKCWGSNFYGGLGKNNTTAIGDNSDEMGANLAPINLGSGRTAITVTNGWDDSCSLLDNSTVKCWGRNNSGQLGQGHTTGLGDNSDEMGDNLSTINLGTGRLVIKVVSGGEHNCALLDNATIKCWGRNDTGQLGQGHASHLGNGVDEMGENLSTVNLGTSRIAIGIFNGDHHTCAVLDNGTIKCWGFNASYGALGQGHVASLGDNADEMGDNLSTVKLGTDRIVIMGSGGYSHSCVLFDNFSVKCWGGNGFGQAGQGHPNYLGNNADEMGDNLSSLLLGTGRSVTSVGCGRYHCCAVLDNGSAKCWGINGYGELGQGTIATIGDGADEMGDNLSAIKLGTGRTALQIKGGSYLTCALLDNSTTKCWGINNAGQLGQGRTGTLGDNADEMGDNLSTITLSSPARTVLSIYGQEYGNCALLDGGAMKCWGYNGEGFAGQEGILGQGHANDIGNSPDEMGYNLSEIKLGTNKYAKAIGGGGYSPCAILNDSTLKCFGINSSGGLGQGHYDNLGDNANEMGDNLSTINLGTGQIPIAIHGGTSHNCALLNNLTLKCWGIGYYGQLGMGNGLTLGDDPNEMGDNLSTVNLGSGRKVLSMSMGWVSSCSLLDDSSVKCWGFGGSGNIGLGNINHIGDNPDEMGDNLSAVNLGSGLIATSISAGGGYVCAILSDFSVKCWGSGAEGQLGLGTTDTRGDGPDELGDNLSSINLGTNRNVIALSTGVATNCAILDNHSVKCWGDNYGGSLGIGNTTRYGDDPDEMGDNLSTVNLGTDRKIMQLSDTNNEVFCALLDNGFVKCWGWNEWSMLGQGHTDNLGDNADEMGDNLSTVILW